MGHSTSFVFTQGWIVQEAAIQALQKKKTENIINICWKVHNLCWLIYQNSRKLLLIADRSWFVLSINPQQVVKLIFDATPNMFAKRRV